MGDLYIGSVPVNAAVYLNDDYIGTTSMAPVVYSDDHRSDWQGQLRLADLPPGKYKMRIIAVPDAEITPKQVMDVEFTFGNEDLYMKADILMRGEVTVQDAKGKIVDTIAGTHPFLKDYDPFDALESDMESFGKDSFGAPSSSPFGGN